MFTLCRDGRELPDGRPESSQERRDHRPSGCGQMVAMRAGDLADQPMRAKQPQLATDPGRAAAPFLAGRGRVGEEDPLQVAVPKPVHGELAAAHGGEQGMIVGVERTECPDSAAVPLRGLAEAVEQVVQCGVVIDAGQGVQIALGGLARNLRPPVEIGDPRRMTATPTPRRGPLPWAGTRGDRPRC